LLDEAVAARQLLRCDTKELAGLLQQLHDGAMLGWAVFREGTLEGWVRREVGALLRPYVRTTSARKKSVRGAAGKGLIRKGDAKG
jgi:hypothetical protein